MFRLLTFAVAALGSALLLPPEASATAQFSGHVFDSDGHPVAGAIVRAGYNTFVPFSWLFLTAGQAITAADGSYEIDDLSAQPPAFSYWIVASAAGRTMSVYANHPCYWPEGCLGSFQMQGVVDSVQPPASGLDFTLRHAVEISGRVSVAATDTPIAHPLLTLLHHESGTYIFPGVDAVGHYDITGLQPGSYTAFVEPGSDDDLISQAYAGFDYDGSMDQEQVDAGTNVLHLAEGQSAIADFALHAASHISGTLTSALDGTPVTSDISVHRVDAPDSAYRIVGNGTGAYSIKLAQGSFDLRFDKNDWWSPHFTAQPISIGTGEAVTGIDVQLMPRNAFEGQVTDAATHQPVAGARVSAGPESSIGVLQQATAISDASGHYILQGVGANIPYYIWSDQVPGYLETDYSNGSGTWTALVLNDSEFRAGVNLELWRGAYVSGHVYDQDTGAPVAGALVSIRYSASELGATNAVSAADGSYQTSAVPTGTYYAFAYVPELGTFVWPGVPCQEPCELTPAEALLLDQTVEYPHTDFRLPHIDLIMRSSFD